MLRVFLVALLALANAAPPPIRLQVRPLIAQAPTDVHLKIFIERHPDNRRLDFILDGDRYSRTSSQTLEGEQSPAVFDIWYRAVPCGSYQAAAQLVRADGSTHVARAQVMQFTGLTCD